MNIQPIGNYILIEAIAVEMKSKSGIIYGDLEAKASKGNAVIEEWGKVLKVGEKVTNCKEGDIVYFKEYNLDRVKYGDVANPDTIFLLEDRFVMGIDNGKAKK